MSGPPQAGKRGGTADSNSSPSLYCEGRAFCLVEVMTELAEVVLDFGVALKAVDGRRPTAINLRTKAAFQAGIGPFAEAKATELIFAEMAQTNPLRYSSYKANVPYVSSPRKKCDVCVGVEPMWQWCIEVKLLRLLGDNGKLNDNMLMHILSPYDEHRSALTDCGKLLESGLNGRKAIVIYGFSDPAWPLEPAVDAFESLAGARHRLGPRHSDLFDGLVHPVHSQGGVFGWELFASESE